MYKFLPKVFDFTRNTIQFLQIILMFFLLLLVLYWTESISGVDIVWLDKFSRILNIFVYLGSLISDGVTEYSGTVFEHKYICSFAVIIILYFTLTILSKINDGIMDLCDKIRLLIKKTEQIQINKQLESNQRKEAIRFKKYAIYISTSAKQDKYTNIKNVDLNEQNKIMNKFLIKETETMPEAYKKGFLYKFSNFNDIDKNIDILFKLLRLDSPVDYQICVQIYSEKNLDKEMLDRLINLNLYNKITMFSETAYYYRCNILSNYKTFSLGIFQKESNTIEAFYFEEN